MRSYSIRLFLKTHYCNKILILFQPFDKVLTFFSHCYIFALNLVQMQISIGRRYRCLRIVQLNNNQIQFQTCSILSNDKYFSNRVAFLFEKIAEQRTFVQLKFLRTFSGRSTIKRRGRLFGAPFGAISSLPRLFCDLYASKNSSITCSS